MRLSKTLPFLTSAILLTLTLSAQQSVDSLVRKAWFIQDQRSNTDGSLADLLVDRAPQVREAAFRAVAHLRDTTWRPSTLNGLRDQRPSVRKMAAFAAGQIGQPSFAPFLLDLAIAERTMTVQEQLLDAFGRVGTESDLDSLVDRWSQRAGRSKTSGLAALMRFSVRGIRSSRGIWYAVECLGDRDPEVRWRALYVLGRWAPHPSFNTEVATHAGRFATATRDRSPDVRVNAAIFLGKVDSDRAREMLTDFSGAERQRNDSDWRVRVQIVRAAAAQLKKDGAMIGILINGLQDQNDHVTIAAAMALPSDQPGYHEVAGRDSLRSVLWGLVRSTSARAPLVAGEVMVGLVRFLPNELTAFLEWWHGADRSARLTTKFLEAVSQAPRADGWNVMKNSWDDERAFVAMAAWDNSRRFLRPAALTLIAPDSTAMTTVLRDVTNGLSRALAKGDMGISTVAATLLADSHVVALLAAGGFRGAMADSLVKAVDCMKVPDDVEALQAALQALAVLGGPAARDGITRQFSSPDRSVVESAIAAWTTLTGEPPAVIQPGRAQPEHTDYDWDLLKEVSSQPRVEFVTDRGSVVCELLPDDAPFTVVSFVRLARSGYFNGLTFHRVVPNFVVQGGDPRGDGWGGPGYALRTETTPRPYERGSVGMASAGFDTEGSQFFITHIATPHLNARYTIFARVTSGMEVVDRIQVGDVIREVVIQARERHRGARSR